MKHILGISAGFHDAAATVVCSDGEILFAGHSERYSSYKNDHCLHSQLLEECQQWPWDIVSFYERPWIHNLQQIVSGQRKFGPWTTRGAVRRHLGSFYKKHPPGQTMSFPHHLSHAAAGFQTSPFDRAAVVVIDAIGELDTISIYRAEYNSQGQAQYQRMWRQQYPHSIGLFYSAVTELVGLRPMEEEYITMGMAAYGSRMMSAYMNQHWIHDYKEIQFKKNFHIGIDPAEFADADAVDIAASAQHVTEKLILNVMERARRITACRNLVFMGGVALNCVANSQLGGIFDDIWIMPNPGDAGSSLGAAALAHGGRLNWRTPFLGHEIPGDYPVNAILDELITNKIVGVASGRAEFGPRALGNRSLLADPRGPDIKDRVNEIKRRQKFRPFAPVILSEYANEYFRMPVGWNRSPYMQIVAEVRQPNLFPAISHVDNSARVQTVDKDNSGIRELLEKWYVMTGCPMLLNTSLNVRGEPMINDRHGADRFEMFYNVKVCS